MKETAVVLIAKAPVAGEVKTRFCPPCTAQQAADFAAAFICDAVQVLGEMATSVDGWCAHMGDESTLRQLLPSSIQMMQQRGEDFAERLANVAADALDRGYERVILLAADCPTVDGPYLRAAIDGLGESDVSIGPANDGGYTLIGLKKPDPQLFVGIKMGTETVFRETIERIHERQYSVVVLPRLHDIDTLDELFAARDAGQLSHAKFTLGLTKEFAPT